LGRKDARRVSVLGALLRISLFGTRSSVSERETANKGNHEVDPETKTDSSPTTDAAKSASVPYPRTARPVYARCPKVCARPNCPLKAANCAAAMAATPVT